MLSIEKILLFIILLNPLLLSQGSGKPDAFNTPDQIIKFADFLFCSGDYFRAALEYERYLRIADNDTIQFKAALGYSYTGKYYEAKNYFNDIPLQSRFYDNSLLEYYKIFLLEKDFGGMITQYADFPSGLKENNPALQKLLYSGMLVNDELPSRDSFSDLFGDDSTMLDIYDRKASPETRSPMLAGILSALVPGAGKVYTGQYLDGLFAFISTGLFVFLAYDNFEAGHDPRAWLFTGLASLFYAGNIYGSAASANEFNLIIRAAFEKDLILTLEKQNYFIPPYDFCK